MGVVGASAEVSINKAFFMFPATSWAPASVMLRACEQGCMLLLTLLFVKLPDLELSINLATMLA